MKHHTWLLSCTWNSVGLFNLVYTCRDPVPGPAMHVKTAADNLAYEAAMDYRHKTNTRAEMSGPI